MLPRLSSRISASFILLFALAITGCKDKRPIDFSQGLPDGQLALRKIPLDQYPDFTQGTWNLNVLGRSIDNSIAYLSKPSSQKFFPYLDITHQRALASLYAFRAVLNEAMARGPEGGAYINQQIRANFEVYKSWGAPDPEKPGAFTDIVQFTGYCTPDRDASPVRTGVYQFPIYKRPPDLVTDPMTGETLGRRGPDGKVVPYWTRQEIETQNKLSGLELYYLKSRWEAYVVTVQGSARLKLTDANGQSHIVEVGFNGQNGYEYTSIGRQMVADGVLSADQLSLRSLTAYFAAHPEAEDKYLNLNKRTVFFTETHGGPFGCLNVPVTTFGTIATDKQVYPRAMPAFLIVPIPRTDNPTVNWPFRGFMLDQDAGGAIRASGRCDIYMGLGDQGEALAGHQLSEGALYYIAVKPELVGQYAGPGAGR